MREDTSDTDVRALTRVKFDPLGVLHGKPAADNRRRLGATQRTVARTRVAVIRDTVARVIDALDRGNLRVAEKIDGIWTTHQWIKKAVLLSFRIAENAAIGLAGPHVPFRFYDKVPTKFAPFDDAAFADAGVRVVLLPSPDAAPSSPATSC